MDLPEPYEKLYPEVPENNRTEIEIPEDMPKTYIDKIIDDYNRGFHLANEKSKSTLGIDAHRPRKVKVVPLPLTKYKGKIGVIQGAYNPETDELFINSAFYHPSCYTPLIDYDDNGKIRYISKCYKLDGNPSETHAHELIHGTFNEISYNQYKNEIATRKIAG